MPQITSNLDLVLQHLKLGYPVAVPTETVYGLAARIDHKGAIRAIFTLKNRPLDHPLIMHVAQSWDLGEWVQEIPDHAKALINAFWPGPLTLILRCKPGTINPLITGGQDTVAVRCPAHSLAQKLLGELATPLVAPSANPFGKISPTTAEHVQKSFSQKKLLILDGGRCSMGIESTIVDVSKPQGYQILRHGLITEQDIAQKIATPCLNEKNNIRVPGTLESHYQPQKTLYYFEHYQDLNRFCQNQETPTYVIASQQPASIKDKYFHPLANQVKQVAFDLYFVLRTADESKAKCIAIELPTAKEEWQGIRERILKAGQPPPKNN